MSVNFHSCLTVLHCLRQKCVFSGGRRGENARQTLARKTSLGGFQPPNPPGPGALAPGSHSAQVPFWQRSHSGKGPLPAHIKFMAAREAHRPFLRALRRPLWEVYFFVFARPLPAGAVLGPLFYNFVFAKKSPSPSNNQWVGVTPAR